MNKFKTQELVIVGLFIALIVISSYIAIPIAGVPVTMQTLAIMLTGLLLSPRLAGVTVGSWILMGVVNLPVFAQGKSGIGTLFGPTGGYIFGFLLCTIFIAYFKNKKMPPLKTIILCAIGNFAIIYPLGVIGLHFFAGMSFIKAFRVGVLTFLIGDCIKIGLATLLTNTLYKNAYHYIEKYN